MKEPGRVIGQHPQCDIDTTVGYGGVGPRAAGVSGLISSTSPLLLWSRPQLRTMGEQATTESASDTTHIAGDVVSAASRLFGGDCTVVWHGDVQWLEPAVPCLGDTTSPVSASQEGTRGEADVPAFTHTRWETVRPLRRLSRPCSHGCNGEESRSDLPMAVRWRCERCAMSTVDRDSPFVSALDADSILPAATDGVWLQQATMRRTPGSARADVCFSGVPVVSLSARLALTLRHVCASHLALGSETAAAVFAVRFCDQWRDNAVVKEHVVWLRRVVPCSCSMNSQVPVVAPVPGVGSYRGSPETLTGGVQVRCCCVLAVPVAMVSPVHWPVVSCGARETGNTQ